MKTFVTDEDGSLFYNKEVNFPLVTGVKTCYNVSIVKMGDYVGLKGKGVADMFQPKVKNDQTELLMNAVLTLETPEEAYRFFEDICTIAEIKSIAQRLEVAVLLRKGVTYQEIARRTGASSATISRVNRALTYGADGYNYVLDVMEARDEI